jgi:hypothetical protein
LNYPANTGYAQQGGYAQQQALNQVTGYPDQPPVPTRLGTICAHAESLNEALARVLERLNRLGDRLLGSQPQEAKADQGLLRGTGGGLTTNIDAQLEHSATLLSRLQAATERLETL